MLRNCHFLFISTSILLFVPANEFGHTWSSRNPDAFISLIRKADNYLLPDEMTMKLHQISSHKHMCHVINTEGKHFVSWSSLLSVTCQLGRTPSSELLSNLGSAQNINFTHSASGPSQESVVRDVSKLGTTYCLQNHLIPSPRVVQCPRCGATGLTNVRNGISNCMHYDKWIKS